MAGTSTLALAAGPALVASAVWIAGRVVGHSSDRPPRFVGWLAGDGAG